STPPYHSAPYTPSLHDALPICPIRPRSEQNDLLRPELRRDLRRQRPDVRVAHHVGSLCDRLLARELPAALRASHRRQPAQVEPRSEEHTSELQSQSNLVCRLLL